MRDKYNLTADELKRLYCKLDEMTPEITPERIERLTELTGDIHFVEGIHRVVKTQAEKSSAPTYMYKFTYDRAPSIVKKIFNCTHMKGIHDKECYYCCWYFGGGKKCGDGLILNIVKYIINGIWESFLVFSFFFLFFLLIYSERK